MCASGRCNVVRVRGYVVYNRVGLVGFPLLFSDDGHETLAETSLKNSFGWLYCGWLSELLNPV